ncbi:MAG: D-alanine--poly(phosphoribitol) ligase subunit DltA [Exiguobacterium sp.]|nr:D-alanine--poly(phosphoribitol) ligase subunit DltA [Exiguobacterium sp.]
MEYLEHVESNAMARPDVHAIVTSSGQCATFEWLWNASEAIASFIDRHDVPSGQPIIVYGHKDPRMLACFHGCLKSGHPYVPIDRYSVPDDRARNIASQVNAPFIFAIEEHPFDGCNVVCKQEVDDIIACGGASDRGQWVSGEDVAYIIFTSGSTGVPKGVQVTSDCFDNFCKWALDLGGVEKTGKVFLNQAPFSFDLSVYEVAMSLWVGGTLYCLAKETQEDMKAMMEALASSNTAIWVSTPSFADMCLVNKGFDESLVPSIELFLFCGETLTNETVKRLMERFPNAIVMNTYGPTESTVAVTEVIVSEAMANSPNPIPCGIARPGTRIAICDADGSELPVGEYGEIVIQGDTVALGYYGRPDLTERCFGSSVLNGVPVRTYRTGDEGRLDDEGFLHYRGRLDLQIKLNGFRIELGDIEENLRKLPGIASVAVVPAYRNGKIAHLVAHVVSSNERTESDFREGLKLKAELESVLPHYMIPRKFVFHDKLPMTGNGKIDRKLLAIL